MIVTEKDTVDRLKALYDVYNKSYVDLNKMISNVYDNYSQATGLDKQKLQELLSLAETGEVWKQLKGQELEAYISTNYKARITRLEKLQHQVYSEAMRIAEQETTINTEHLQMLFRENYYSTIYDTFDTIEGFSILDRQAIDVVIGHKWSGKHYSERIWDNTDKLAKKLSDVIGRGTVTGASYQRMAREIRDEFGVGKYQATRLIRTESNFIHNEAEARAYEDMGVTKYIFLATLDNRTSVTCQELDGKKFKLKNKEIGVNYPPMHPNCRSTTMPDTGSLSKPEKRVSRNVITGELEEIDWVTYQKWIKRFGNDN
jgi:SPP1 gp7 family putative phage head morphogenesis protein